MALVIIGFTHTQMHIISGFFFLKCLVISHQGHLFQDPRVAHVPLKLKEKNPEKITNANDLVNL